MVVHTHHKCIYFTLTLSLSHFSCIIFSTFWFLYLNNWKKKLLHYVTRTILIESVFDTTPIFVITLNYVIILKFISVVVLVSCLMFVSVLFCFYIFFCDTLRQGLHLGDIEFWWYCLFSLIENNLVCQILII